MGSRFTRGISSTLVLVGLLSAAAGGAEPPSCIGDCNRDGRVTVNELVAAVSIGLGTLPLTQCPGLDPNHDQAVFIDEILRAVHAALGPCAPLPLTTAQVLRRGPYGVGRTTISFIDTTRQTAAAGMLPAAPTRTLLTEIWYPIDPVPASPATGKVDAPLLRTGAPYPLIVHSHGFMDFRTGNAYANQQLASYGYVVAAPDFPLTNYLAANSSGSRDNIRDLVNQPGDVSFLITQLLNLSNAADGAFAGAIDANRIGLSGLSLGGATTLLATFHHTLHDARVRAAATMAPGLGCALSHDFYAEADVALLIMHGDLDAIVAYQENAVFAFQQANPPKYLATLVAGTHTGFSGAAYPLFNDMDNADSVGCSSVTDNIPSDGPSVIDLLGGPDTGVIAGDCPLPCPDGPDDLPLGMRPLRQHNLTILTIVSFFEAELRGRADMRQFLEQTLAAENSDVTVQAGR